MNASGSRRTPFGIERGDELRRRQRIAAPPRERRALPGPQRQVVAVVRARRPAQRLVSAFCTGYGAASATRSPSRAISVLRSPRAWRPVIARVTCVDVSVLASRRAFQSAAIALSVQVRNAVPSCAPCAPSARGRDPAAVHDAARGEHGQAGRVDQLRHERERTDQRIVGGTDERAAMATRPAPCADSASAPAACQARPSATCVAVPIT